MPREDAMSNRQMHEIVRDQRPATLPPSATVQEACRRMRADRIEAIAVTDSAKGLQGIFTARDAVRALAENPSPGTVTLREAMTREPTAMTPDCTAIDALRLMRDGGLQHLPVLKDGRVIGVVSLGDFRGLEVDQLDFEIGLWERLR